MTGKLLFRGLFCLFSAFIIVVFFGRYSLRSFKNEGFFGGVKYKFNVYDIDGEKISFSRSDKSPELFTKYPWVPAATLKLGGVFMESWSDEKLNACFESPAEDPSKFVPELLSQTNLVSNITIVGLIKFKIYDHEYFYVSMRTSDFPDYTHFTLLKKVRDRWVIPSERLSPVSDLYLKAYKLKHEIMEEAKNGRVKYSPLTDLK